MLNQFKNVGVGKQDVRDWKRGEKESLKKRHFQATGLLRIQEVHQPLWQNLWWNVEASRRQSYWCGDQELE
jgi:hypothetical protein